MFQKGPWFPFRKSNNFRVGNHGQCIRFFAFLEKKTREASLGSDAKKSSRLGCRTTSKMLPVIETGAFQLGVIDFEAEWIDQMQGGLGGQAQAANGPGVVGNFRFDQNNLEIVRHGAVSGSGSDAVIVTFEPSRTASPDNRKKSFRPFLIHLIQKCVQLVVGDIFPVFAVVGPFQRKAGKVIHFNVVTVFSHGI